MAFDTSNPAKPTETKDPNAVLDYVLDLSAWLAEVEDSLASVHCTSVGVTVDRSSIDGDTVVVWVSGGTAGATGTVTIRFTTAAGRVDDRTLYFKIRER